MSKQSSQMPQDDERKMKTGRRAVKKTFRLEYRARPERLHSSFMKRWSEWKMCWKKYETAEQREMAMNAMNRKMELFEYRIPEE